MNDQDFKEIDRALSIAFDEGYNAAKIGKSKYENDYEPGCLSFDSWAAGWRSFQPHFNQQGQKDVKKRRKL